jgi:hypothetical protein
VGKLARSGRHTPGGRASDMDHAVWIQVWLVWTGVGEADGSHGGTDAAAGTATREEGIMRG